MESYQSAPDLDAFESWDFAEAFWNDFNLDEAFSSAPSLRKSDDFYKRLSVAVSASETTPYSADIRDLCRLYWLCANREVATVLELGSGYSSGILALAMERNSRSIGSWVSENRRLEAPFLVRTLEEDPKWSNLTRDRIATDLATFIDIRTVDVETFVFNGRFATRYRDQSILPADLVLIDGPSQHAPKINPGEWTTANIQLMPMSGDILPIEHFFEPGAVIVVDGRTANARFLKSNLQRNWAYRHLASSDVHIFELQEEPLGAYNALRLERLNESGWLI